MDVSDCGAVAFAADAVHIYFERGVSGVNRIESGEGGLPPLPFLEREGLHLLFCFFFFEVVTVGWRGEQEQEIRREG